MDIIMKKIKKFVYYYASFKQVMKDKQFIREIEKKNVQINYKNCVLKNLKL